MLNDVSSLHTWKDKHVVVLGDLMLDVSKYGRQERLNPESPSTPLLKGTSIDYRLGGAANVAHNLKTLGARVTVYGLVGDDFHGSKLRSLLEEQGITAHLYSDGRETIAKERTYETTAGSHYLIRYDTEMNTQPLAEHLIPPITHDFERDVPYAEAIVFSDYAKGFFRDSFAQSLLTLSHRHHLPTLVDTKPQNFVYFRGATVLKPNLAEAQAMTHVHLSHDQDVFHDQFAHALCRRLRELGNIDYAFITCGGKGIVGIDKKDSVTFAPTKPLETYDIVGAGDTTLAALTLGFVTDYKKNTIHMKRIMDLANLAAGIVVLKTGTSVVTLDELIQACEATNSSVHAR